MFSIFEFYFYGVTQFLAKKEFDIFRGTPYESQNFKIIKSDHTWHPITKYFHCRISKYYQIKDVCKKTRAQNFEFRPNGRHFCKTNFFRFLKTFLNISSIFSTFFFGFLPVG